MGPEYLYAYFKKVGPLSVHPGTPMAPPRPSWKRSTWWPALRTSALYALVALLWIYFSDRLVGILFRDPAQITRVSTLKGTLFVLVTALILFLDRRSGERASRRERRETEASEARFRSLTEQAPMGIALRGPGLEFQYLSPRFTELFGYTQEEVAAWGQWLGRAYPDPEYRAQRRREWEEDFGHLDPARDHIHERTNRVVCKDGTVKSVLMRGRALDDGSWLMTFEDNTLREAAEAALRAASEERLAMLEAASLARVVPWSMDAAGWMQWGDSRDAVFRWPGGTRRRRQGWPWDRIHPDDHLRFRIALAKADRGLVDSFECRMPQEGDRWIWTRWTLAADGGRYHGAVQDIHDQHEVQAQLLQTQKLESMGTLVGGITHDFNNLLMAILGFSELMLQDPGLTPAQHKGLDTIHRAAARGRSLIDQFLGFSRKLPTRRIQANLNTLVEEASHLLRHALSNRVELRLELAPDLPDALFDPSQLHQVVMNLALNARDAIQDHGTITLRTALAEVPPEFASAHGRPPGAYLCLEVADDGVGIPAETLHRIYEPFFTTKGAKGTGLGLSMVHGIVMEHDGILECRSEVGQGTVLAVHLPLMATAPDHGAADPAGSRELDILVLAAGAGLGERIGDALGMLGQRFTLAGSAEEALDRLVREPWDLLVLEPEALPRQGPLLHKTLEARAWPGRVVSVGSRLDPALQPRTLGHLSRAFSLFDLVEILDRMPREDPPHGEHPAP